MPEHASLPLASLSGAAVYAWLVPLLPFLAFWIIALVTRPWGKVSALISIAAVAASCVVSFPIFLERLEADLPAMQGTLHWIPLETDRVLGSIDVGILVDNLSALMILMVSFVATCIQVYSYAYIDTEIRHFPTQGSASMSRFFACLSLFTASMLGLVLSTNLLQIYIFWELVGVCSYLLIGFWYFKESAAEAAKKAFVVTRFGDLGFLLGLLALGVQARTFDFVALNQMASGQAGVVLTPAFVALAAVLIFCGAVGKSAQFPLQIWLPDAMEGPTPVSALIHAATMVAAGVYLVGRMFPVFHFGPEAAAIVAWIGAITAFLAATVAVVQNDIKRVLAYSTISQLGYMMAALGAGAYTAGIFHLTTHAFFKALLFLGSGAVIVACHSQDMWTMGGLRRRLPITTLTFAVGCLALAGFPGFSGFWSKDEILAGTAGTPIHYVLLVSAFLTAFYVTRMYLLTFEGPHRGHAPEGLGGPVPPPSLPQPEAPSGVVFGVRPEWTEEKAARSTEKLPPACRGALMEEHPHHPHEPREVSPVMWLPLAVLAVFAAFLGFAGVPGHLLPIDNYFQKLIHPPGAGHAEHPFDIQGMLVSICVALAGMGVAAAVYARDPASGERRLMRLLGPAWTFLQQKWYMDHLWARLLSWTLFSASNVAAWFDERVVDGLVFGTGRCTVWLGREVSYEQTGKVQNYLVWILIFLLVLGIVAGFREKAFVMSPWYLWEFVFRSGGGSPTPGGFTP